MLAVSSVQEFVKPKEEASSALPSTQVRLVDLLATPKLGSYIKQQTQPGVYLIKLCPLTRQVQATMRLQLQAGEAKQQQKTPTQAHRSNEIQGKTTMTTKNTYTSTSLK